MIFGTKPKISERIISSLAEGPLDSLVLLGKLKEAHQITKQGFYRALRELMEEEIVTKNKQLIILSPFWINKLGDFAKRLESNTVDKGAESLFNLSEGDTIVFRFKSITDLYLLWTHYFFILCKGIDGSVVFFNGHNFWALFRSDIENEMYAWIKNNNKEAYTVIGHNTPLDKSTSEYIKTDYGIEVAFEKTPSVKETIFPAVFGDYVMSTVLDKDTVDAIDALYHKYEAWQPEIQTELEEIISKIQRSKVVIERNQKKAEKLRKKLMKYFIFYKPKLK